MKKEITDPYGERTEKTSAFQGYAPPTSSTLYTPNQFFDVVLRNASRGTVRLVAYLMRKTLGWSDENGNPQNETAYVTYSELVTKAGISRGMIRESIEEAIRLRYIDCLSLGKPHTEGESAATALYRLRWDESGRYTTDPNEFDGFFAGNGNLTYVPNQFFDVTVRNEPLALVQVVGTIIRNTIGWRNTQGYQRKQVAMSLGELMRRTGLSKRSVQVGLQGGIDGNHLVCVRHGVFTHDKNQQQASVYGVRWADGFGAETSEVAPALTRSADIGTKSIPEESVRKVAKENDNGSKSSQEKSVQKIAEDGLEGSPEAVRKVAKKRFEKYPSIEITSSNNTPKQHSRPPVVAVEKDSLARSMQMLMTEGISREAAFRLARAFSLEAIEQQIRWLPLRNVRESRTGFLIRAIEQNMARPEVIADEASPARNFAAHFYAGIANNEDTPTAEPSREDIRLSQGYIERLPKEVKPEVLGREFAKVVRKRHQGRKDPILTLALALRLHGDEFYSSRVPMTDRQSVPEAKTRVEQEQQLRYEAFVNERLESLYDSSEVTEQFEHYMSTRLVSRRRVSTRAYEMLRAQAESDEGRADLFREFVRRTFPDLIPDIKEWDNKRSTDGDVEP